MAVHHIATPYTFHEAVALHDTNDNLIGALFVMNTGTSGSVTIRMANGRTSTAVYLAQGSTMYVGRDWRGAMSTGATAGLSLVAFK